MPPTRSRKKSASKRVQKSRSKTNLKTIRTKPLKQSKLISKVPDLRDLPLWDLGQLYLGWFKKRGDQQIFSGYTWRYHRPDNFTFLNLSTHDLMSYFIHSDTCRGDVTQKYIEQSLNGKCTNVFVMFYPLPARFRTRFYAVGFLMGYNQDPTTFYIDVVCAKTDPSSAYRQHNGKLLIQTVEDLMFSKGVREIELSALPVVLTYYPRLGYNHRKSCTKPPEFVYFTPELTHRLMYDKASLPRDNVEAILDPDFQTYMILLLRAGYLPNCNEYANASDEEILHALVELNCQSSGFKMRKCMEQPSSQYDNILVVSNLMS